MKIGCQCHERTSRTSAAIWGSMKVTKPKPWPPMTLASATGAKPENRATRSSLRAWPGRSPTNSVAARRRASYSSPSSLQVQVPQVSSFCEGWCDHLNGAACDRHHHCLYHKYEARLTRVAPWVPCPTQTTLNGPSKFGAAGWHALLANRTTHNAQASKFSGVATSDALQASVAGNAAQLLYPAARCTVPGCWGVVGARPEAHS